MALLYIEQPVAETSELKVHFEKKKMNLALWPQVIPPSEVVEAYKKEVERNREDFEDCLGREDAERITKIALNEANDPYPLIRTKWGCLFGMKFPSSEGNRGSYSVQIYVAPAWRCEKLQQAKSIAKALLETIVKEANSHLRSVKAPRGMRLHVEDGLNGALAGVTMYYRDNKKDETESDTGDLLAAFFVVQCIKGTLDELIRYIGIGLQTHR